MPQLSTRDGVHLLDLTADETNPENRFTEQWIVDVGTALDAVEAAPAPLVAHATGKFFSNGLDVAWVMANPDGLPAYAGRAEALFARFLTLGVPTVAALNGHAFGAGALLALCFDWRVQREDRGFFCLPEVDIKMPFTAGMSALCQAKLSPRTAVDAMTTGARFGGADALAAGIADGVAGEDDLLDAAVAKVAHLQGKDPATLHTIKSTMYADAVRALTSAGQ
ncbi:enoyl-CoA hydratase/isomerase family protein [Nocardioides montaniterrae]